MLSLIAQYWPYIIATAGVIVTITKFRLDTLRIREARLKIKNLERAIKDKESPIHRVTTSDIEKYGMPPLDKNMSSPVSRTGKIRKFALGFSFMMFFSLSLNLLLIAYLNKNNQIVEKYESEFENLSQSYIALLEQIAEIEEALHLPMTSAMPLDTPPETLERLEEIENKRKVISSSIQEAVKQRDELVKFLMNLSNNKQKKGD